jgi:hypothetical protein
VQEREGGDGGHSGEIVESSGGRDAHKQAGISETSNECLEGALLQRDAYSLIFF